VQDIHAYLHEATGCNGPLNLDTFFRSLKTERLNYQSFANHYEVVQNAESYIYFYNYKRIHSAIGYLTPAHSLSEAQTAIYQAIGSLSMANIQNIFNANLISINSQFFLLVSDIQIA
jgi:hypothetical protein